MGLKTKIRSFEDILKEELLKCKTTDEKFLKLIDIFCNQTRLLDIILNNLSPKTTEKILKEAGFTEFFN